LPGIVAAVLGDWCGQHRATTIAAHELLLVARRDPAYAEPGRRWIDGQLRVWSGLIGRLGLGDDPSLAAFVLELLLGLSLMTFGCDNPVEAALANDEIVRYAFADAEGRRAFDPRWYRMFLARADREVLPTEDAGVGSANDTAHPAARKILDAGIGIVAEEGSGALTFRGVAARAGVAISSVTNNFHTRENLIYSVYRRIQDSMAEVSLRAPPSSPPPPPGDFVPDSQIALLKRVSTGEFPLFLAAYDLMLAGARDPRFGARAWRIRITRGVYLLVRRGVMPAPPLRAQFRSHVSSLWMNAVGLLSGIGGAAPEDRHALIEERLRAGFDRLR
jgi:AcrR family transcriptional regulator